MPAGERERRVPLAGELGCGDESAAHPTGQRVRAHPLWNDPRSDALMALEYDGSTVLIGTDEDDTIIASAMAGFDGHRGWVYYVPVVPTLQGSGLGQEIMDAAESWLVGQGVH